PASVGPETGIGCAGAGSGPVVAVVWPAAEAVVRGADQPLGTSSVIAPLESPPAAAVYVKTSFRPVAEAETFVVGVVSVPEPSAAFTVTLGEEPRLLSEPAETDFSFACQVWAPVEDVTVAPEPPPL